MENIAKYIDHTLLKPFAKQSDIKRLCEEAVKYGFASVCVHPCHVEFAKAFLNGTAVKTATVAGFPLGANTSKAKAFEVENAVSLGADEIDMVINIGALKDKRYDMLLCDIKEAVAAAKGKIVKAIIETYYLTDEEKAYATRISCQAGVHFVKTCTGFNEGVATLDDIKIIRENLLGKVNIKASGGIRTYKEAAAFIAAGAKRIGTSAGIAIAAGQYL